MRMFICVLLLLNVPSCLWAASFTGTAFVTAMPASIEVKGTYTLGQNEKVDSLKVDVGSYNQQTGVFTLNQNIPQRSATFNRTNGTWTVGLYTTADGLVSGQFYDFRCTFKYRDANNVLQTAPLQYHGASFP